MHKKYKIVKDKDLGKILVDKRNMIVGVFKKGEVHIFR